MQQQRRGRSIAMPDHVREAFLAQERTCRVATVGADGSPHVTPLWFAWDGQALWLTSLVKSQRWADALRDPRVAVVVDAGQTYEELRGVELRGRVEPVGEAPRPADAAPDPRLARAESLFADKYRPGQPFLDDGRHGWLRLTPDKIISWDFRASREVQSQA